VTNRGEAQEETPSERREAVRGGETICPACGSDNLTGIEWYGATGVTSPDGGREYRLQVGFRCLDCGQTEEL
jgi:hypothetical protein